MTRDVARPTIIYRNGKQYTQAAASSEVVDRPDAGVYNLIIDEQGIRLVEDENYSYTFPKKIYGNVVSSGDNIIRTWMTRDKNTGVLLSGAQGTGKSLTAQYVIHKAVMELGAVVIDVTKPILEKAAFTFIQNLNCPVIMFIDEFEKKYDWKAQEENLSYMDGSSLEGVLWLLTANRRQAITDFYLHRPSRVYYHYKFDNVDMDTVRKIVSEKVDLKAYNKLQEKKLSKKELAEFEEEIVRCITTFKIRTFDTILSFISEIMVTGAAPSSVLEYLNIEVHQRNKPSNKTYFKFISKGLDGKEEDVTNDYDCKQLRRFVRFNDVFGDGTGAKATEYTEIPAISKNNAYPTVYDLKMDSETYVETPNYDTLRFKVGDTASGKEVFLEFSKVPYPAPEEKETPKESNDNKQVANDNNQAQPVTFTAAIPF